MALFNLVPEGDRPTGNVGVLGNTIGGFAPENLLNTTTVYKAIPAQENGVIDVISTMQIAANDIPQYLRDKLPYCILKEYDLVTNSTVGQLLYYLKSLGYNRQTDGLLDSTGARNILNGFFDSVTDKKGILRDFVGDNVSNILATSLEPFQKILNSNEPLGGALTPYQNLYIREPTEFKYILPYFKDKKKGITTTFGDTQTGLLNNNLFQKFTDSVKGSYEKVAKTLFAATPGAYIEQPKFFGPQQTGESYEIEFELINTVDGDKIQDHFDLLFLLAFQNLPYRRDVATVALPKIYTFIIPGEIYLPYAYISSLTIDFVGNRRMLNIRHPRGQVNGGQTDVKCVVPEVYSVKMTIQGLTTPAANYMVADNLINIESELVNVEPIATVEVGELIPIPRGSSTGNNQQTPLTDRFIDDLNRSAQQGATDSLNRPPARIQPEITPSQFNPQVLEPSLIPPTYTAPTATSAFRAPASGTLTPEQREIRRLVDEEGYTPSEAFAIVKGG